MPSTSKSKKLKFVPEPTQLCPVKQPTRNWLELPSDVVADILYRIGVIDILENAQKVCTAWHKICKDPAMWRVIFMENHTRSKWVPKARPLLEEMCKHAVDRSQGQLVDITIVDFGNDELLRYIADRSSQLRCLKVVRCGYDIYKSWSDALEKFVVLEELSLYATEITMEAIETAGRCCPMLRTLKVNNFYAKLKNNGDFDEEPNNMIAIAIGLCLPNLRHLGIVGNHMANVGLQAILDGCPLLESLDLRRCYNLDLKGSLGKRCSQQIKCLKLHRDLAVDLPYIYEYVKERCVTTERMLRVDYSNVNSPALDDKLQRFLAVLPDKGRGILALK